MFISFTKRSLIGALFLITVFVSCQKVNDSQKEDIEQQLSWQVSQDALDKAKLSLKGETPINFFDYTFVSKNNPNVIASASSRDEHGDQLLNSVIFDLITRNKTEEFYTNLTSNVGFPIWDQSLFFTLQGTSTIPVVVIPFAHLTADSTDACLFATPNANGWDISLYRKTKIDSLLVSLNDKSSLGASAGFFVLAECNIFNKKIERYRDLLLNYGNAVDERDGWWISYCVPCPFMVFQGDLIDDRCVTCYEKYVGGSNGPNGGGSGSYHPNGGEPFGGGGNGSVWNIPSQNPNAPTPIQILLNRCENSLEPGMDNLTLSEQALCSKINILVESDLFTIPQIEFMVNNDPVMKKVLDLLNSNPTLAKRQHLIAVLEFAQQNSLTAAQFLFLFDDEELFIGIKDFAGKDDVVFLIEHPEILAQYKVYLAQNPTATPEEKMIFLRLSEEAPDNPITNLKERLNCFNVTTNTGNAQMERVVIYVDQPIHHDPSVVDDRSGPLNKINVGAGHTWLSIQQQINGVTTVLNVGFYPKNFAMPNKPFDVGAFNDDGGHKFDVAMGFDLTSEKFNQLIADLKNETFNIYDLYIFNCTDWAIKKLQLIDINLSLNPSQGFIGKSPAQLGEDLRNNQSGQPTPNQLIAPNSEQSSVESSCGN